MPLLQYGAASSAEIMVDGSIRMASVGQPHGRPLGDLGLAVAEALHEPLDYPTLAQSTTPSDHVVLALDRHLPQAAQVIAALVKALVEAGVSPDGISVLQTQAPRAEKNNACRLIGSAMRERIAAITHNPEDRRQLAYLAASESGEPILISRALHDADVIISVGCLQADEAAGYFGIHGSVFPSYADAAAAERFRTAAAMDGRSPVKQALIAEADHVAWLLGVNFTVQLVPAPGDGAMHVLAGSCEAVRRRGRELYRAVWNCPPMPPASLVIAGIDGGPDQQTWENVGLSLRTAADFAQPDGAIAVCSELTIAPGVAMQQLAHSRCGKTAACHFDKGRSADALPAAQLAHTLAKHKVYLLSRLDASLVEDLDIIPLGDAGELNRLVRRHSSCVLLSNAQYVTTR